MNTHILIPIAYMEAAINAKKAEIIHSEALKDSIRAGIENYELKILEDLLNTSKQISLDEKDIEEKGNLLGGQFSYKEGYKQSLKDLL